MTDKRGGHADAILLKDGISSNININQATTENNINTTSTTTLNETRALDSVKSDFSKRTKSGISGDDNLLSETELLKCFDRPPWYCFMTVLKKKVVPSSSELSLSSSSSLPLGDTKAQDLHTVGRKRKIVASNTDNFIQDADAKDCQRTDIHIATNPFLYVKEINRTWNGGSYPSMNKSLHSLMYCGSSSSDLPSSSSSSSSPLLSSNLSSPSSSSSSSLDSPSHSNNLHMNEKQHKRKRTKIHDGSETQNRSKKNAIRILSHLTGNIPGKNTQSNGSTLKNRNNHKETGQPKKNGYKIKNTVENDIISTTIQSGSTTVSGSNEGDETSEHFKIAMIIGPLSTKRDAEIIRDIWGFKTRAIIPRAATGELLAQWFKLDIYANMELIFERELKWWTLKQSENGELLMIPNDITSIPDIGINSNVTGNTPRGTCNTNEQN